MRIKCIALLPDLEQSKKLGIGTHYFPGKMVFGIKIGAEYVVYALSFLSGTPWVFLASETGYLHPVPLCLFKIIDDRVSHLWRIYAKIDQDIFIGPNSFSQPHYIEDLSDGVLEVTNDFKKIKKAMDDEAYTS